MSNNWKLGQRLRAEEQEYEIGELVSFVVRAQSVGCIYDVEYDG